MSVTPNRSFLQKADLAIQDLTAGGAYLVPVQAKKFMRLLIKQSELLQMATFVPMGAPKHQIGQRGDQRDLPGLRGRSEQAQQRARHRHGHHQRKNGKAELVHARLLMIV